jgi:hypothetical protein
MFSEIIEHVRYSVFVSNFCVEQSPQFSDHSSNWDCLCLCIFHLMGQYTGYVMNMTTVKDSARTIFLIESVVLFPEDSSCMQFHLWRWSP